MDDTKTIPTNKPALDIQPEQSTTLPHPSQQPTSPTSPPTPQSRKSFLKSPLFWIVIIVLLLFIGAYYFIYNNLENNVSQLTQQTPSSIQASPTIQKVEEVPEGSADEIIAMIVPLLSSEITWQETEHTTESFYFLKSSVSGSLKKGSLTISDYSRFQELITFDELDGLKKSGWLDDNSQAADGPTGSNWGYYKISGNKKQFIHLERTITTQQKEPLPDNEPLDITCPCEINYEVFVSDLY